MEPMEFDSRRSLHLRTRDLSTASLLDAEDPSGHDSQARKHSLKELQLTRE